MSPSNAAIAGGALVLCLLVGHVLRVSAQPGSASVTPAGLAVNNHTNLEAVTNLTAATNALKQITNGPVVFDNGLGDWLENTNHSLGHWFARSTRIVQTSNGQYQPQFRDCNNTNSAWISLFEGEASYNDLSTARFKLRRALEVKVEVSGQLEDAFSNAFKPSTNN